MSAPGCWKLSYIFEKNSSNRDSANLSPSTIPYCHDVYGTRDTIFFQQRNINCRVVSFDNGASGIFGRLSHILTIPGDSK